MDDDMVLCPLCRGLCATDGHWEDCPYCCSPEENYACGRCGGKGVYLVDTACPRCGETGVVPREEVPNDDDI